jgi:hypothetical protein
MEKTYKYVCNIGSVHSLAVTKGYKHTDPFTEATLNEQAGKKQSGAKT